MSVIEATYVAEEPNPLDVVEQMLREGKMEFARETDEINFDLAGMEAPFIFVFTWMKELNLLHACCKFGLPVPRPRMAEVRRLVLHLNAQTWFGHFDYWEQSGTVLFRAGLPLPVGATLTSEQAYELLSNGVDACNQFFPAFNFVVWAGKTAEEAYDYMMLETQGTA